MILKVVQKPGMYRAMANANGTQPFIDRASSTPSPASVLRGLVPVGPGAPANGKRLF